MQYKATVHRFRPPREQWDVTSRSEKNRWDGDGGGDGDGDDDGDDDGDNDDEYFANLGKQFFGDLGPGPWPRGPGGPGPLALSCGSGGSPWPPQWLHPEPPLGPFGPGALGPRLTSRKDQIC